MQYISFSADGEITEDSSLGSRFQTQHYWWKWSSNPISIKMAN